MLLMFRVPAQGTIGRDCSYCSAHAGFIFLVPLARLTLQARGRHCARKNGWCLALFAGSVCRLSDSQEGDARRREFDMPGTNARALRAGPPRHG